MEFTECQDFFMALPTDEIRGDIFNSMISTIETDEQSTVINPEDFLNEAFFRTENETYTSGSFSEPQLTPPISPQPIIVDNIKLIPVTQIYPHNNGPGARIKQSYCNERKMKPILPAKSASGSSDSDSNNQVLDRSSSSLSVADKAQIRQARIIRNRESALQSRRKKKEYVQSLEIEVGDLRREVKQLREENSVLKEKLINYNAFTCHCVNSISSKLSTKNASLMFALLLMIGFNLIPLSNYLSTKVEISDMRTSSSITSRHLLFVENATSDESNSSEIESDKLYFNQTDRVRKANIENVLNWFPQAAEVFNVTNTRNLDSDRYEFEDPLQYKLNQMYEKSRLNQIRKEKKPFKKRIPKKKSTAEDLYNADLFKFHEFFDEIKRKEDTFYVLSFKSDHLLLPAIDNLSRMVKMNLLMPRTNTSRFLNDDSSKIKMLQIETIILNTSLIEVTEKSIPSELVKTYTNSTTVMCNQPKLNNSTKNALKESIVTPKSRKFAPYFQFDLDSNN